MSTQLDDKNGVTNSEIMTLLGELTPFANTMIFFPGSEQAELISITAAGRAAIADANIARFVLISTTAVSATATATSNFPTNASGLTFIPIYAFARVATFAGTLTIPGTVTIEGFAPLTVTGMNAVGKTLPLIPLTTAFTGIANNSNLTAAVVASTGSGLTLTLNLYVFGIYV